MPADPKVERPGHREQDHSSLCADLPKLSSSCLSLGRSTFLLLQYFLYGLAPWRRTGAAFSRALLQALQLAGELSRLSQWNLLEIRFLVSHRSLSFGCVQP